MNNPRVHGPTNEVVYWLANWSDRLVLHIGSTTTRKPTTTFFLLILQFLSLSHTPLILFLSPSTVPQQSLLFYTYTPYADHTNTNTNPAQNSSTKKHSFFFFFLPWPRNSIKSQRQK